MSEESLGRLRRIDEGSAAIWRDLRLSPLTRELALLLTWLINQPEPHPATWKDWMKAAQPYFEHYNPDSAFRLREAIRDDRPRYEPPQGTYTGGKCMAPMIRRAGECDQPASSRLPQYSQETGRITEIYFYCRRHQDVAERMRAQLKKEPAPPEAIPNRGGRLPLHIDWPDWQWIELYRWAWSERWTPPSYGIRADQWPRIGDKRRPTRTRLTLIPGEHEPDGDPVDEPKHRRPVRMVWPVPGSPS